MKQEGRGSLSLSWQQAKAQKGGCGTDARSQACAICVVYSFLEGTCANAASTSSARTTPTSPASDSLSLSPAAPPHHLFQARQRTRKRRTGAAQRARSSALPAQRCSTGSFGDDTQGVQPVAGRCSVTTRMIAHLRQRGPAACGPFTLAPSSRRRTSLTSFALS